MRASIKVLTDPRASRSAKTASAAYVQRNFGIDPAKDYQHLNQAELQLDSLKTEMGKSMLAMGEAQASVMQKLKMMGAKIPREQFTTGAQLNALNNAIKMFDEKITEAEDAGDKASKGMYMKARDKALKTLVSQMNHPFSTAQSKEESGE
jgi:hypothetical protein